VNNLDYLKSVNEVNKLLIKPGFKKSIILKILISFKKAFLGDRTYWFYLKLYRFLSKMGLVVGSSSGSEISSTVMDDNYFMGAAKVQFSQGLRALIHLDELIHRRKKNAAIYSSFLQSNGKIYVKEIFNENHSFLKYPILIKDRVSFLAKAEKASVRLGDWFLSPIHPVESEFEKWFLDPENFPNAIYVSKHVLNLPTEIENPEKVLAFLTHNINDIL
jgi:perosamine synthetase